MNSKRFDLFAIVILLLSVALVYANSLPNNFIFDDEHIIVKNNYIKSLRHVPLFFKGHITSEPIAKGMYRPLLMLTFSFNYFFSRLSPHGYHIVNMLIHFLNAVLLYCMLKFFFSNLKNTYRLLIAVLFCIHPVNTEAVTYIASRSDLLCSFFILASVFTFARFSQSPSRSLYAGSLLLYILALLTKEVALLVMGLLAAYEVMLSKRLINDIKSICLRLMPFVLVTVGYLYFRSIIFGVALESSPVTFATRSLFSNILTQSAVSFYYLYLFFVPLGLCIDHNFFVLSVQYSPLFLVPCALIVAIILAVIFFRKKIHPLIGFSVLWYFISLSPKFYAKLNYICAEHQAYLAYFSLYFIAAFFLSRFKGKIKFVKGFIVFTVLLFSFLTVARNFEWRSKYLLWRSTLKINPYSGLAHAGLGNYFMIRGKYQESYKHLAKAICSPSITLRMNALVNLMNLYAFKGEPEKGFAILKEHKAFFYETKIAGHYSFYKAVGLLHLKAGNPQKALQIWEKAIEINPDNATLKAVIGWWYLDHTEDWQQASNYFKSALLEYPDLGLAHFGLGVIAQGQDVHEAIEHFKNTIKVTPDLWEAYFRLGTIYAQELLDPKAEYYFKKTIELAPRYASAYYNLGVLYLSLAEPDYERASFYIEKARTLGYSIDQEIDAILRAR